MPCALSRSATVAIALFTNICGTTLDSSSLASAASPLERIALQLNGSSCGSQHANISSALSVLRGVRTIDFSVPDHALVDIDSRLLSVHDLLPIITQAVTSPSCRVELMQSCISAVSLTDDARPLLPMRSPGRSP